MCCATILLAYKEACSEVSFYSTIPHSGRRAGKERHLQQLVSLILHRKHRNIGTSEPLLFIQVAALNGFSSIDAEVEFSRKKSAPSGTTKMNPTGKRSASRAPPSTLSEATVAAAAAAAVASADADADTDAEKASSSSSNGDDGEEEDVEAPVFLTFRFRREPMPMPMRTDDAAPEDGGCSSSEASEGDSDEEDEEPPAKAAAEGGSGELSKGPRENGGGKYRASNGSSSDAGGVGKEGRKRAGSGGVGGEGGGSGEKARKRPKGAVEGGGDGGGDVDAQDEEDGGKEEGGEWITVDGTADEAGVSEAAGSRSCLSS